jgi:hypothetical protein
LPVNSLTLRRIDLAMQGEWTGELVIDRLEAVFQRNPDAAMYSVPAVSDLPYEEPIEGLRLIQATALALGLDSPARIHLLYHARARGTGEPIYKLCQIRSWKRGTHYRRVIAASIAVAEWLNARATRTDHLTRRQSEGVTAPPKKGG